MFVYTLLHLAESNAVAVASISFVFGIIAILLDVWITKRVLRSQYYWETSESGLAIGRLFGKHLIPWSDIDYATVIPGVGHEFRTAKETIRLDKQTLEDVCLEASIWQHLNRLEKANALPLSQFAMSLWAQIPDEKVEDLYWENPRPPHADEILLKFVFWQVLIWGIALRIRLEYISLPAIISTWQICSVFCSLVTIKRIAVISDRIESSTAIAKLRFTWENIRSVKFVNGGSKQPVCLQLRAGIFGFVRIPWIPEHPNSTRVMLAIIKRLRQEERFKLLPFPTSLLLAAHGDESQKDFS